MGKIKKPTYEVYSNNPKYRILPNRLAAKREELGMSQKDFVDQMNQHEEITSPLSSCAYSSWERNRRQIPTKYNGIIAEMLGVSIAYLVGVTDDEHKEEADEIMDSNPEQSTGIFKEIKLEEINKYDGLPVYVEFLDYQHLNGWGIFSKKDNQVIMIDHIISQEDLGQTRLYVYNNIQPLLMYDSTRTMKYSDMMKAEYVYIEMTTLDRKVHATYDGIYRHNENRSFLINKNGFTLPYTGFNKSYIVRPAHSVLTDDRRRK